MLDTFIAQNCRILSSILSVVVHTSMFGSFSLRETMIRSNQPFIAWSDGLLSTNHSVIDRQHQWFLTLINLLIHISNGNSLQINLLDVLGAIKDYSCIHFTEEELLFMNEPYPLFRAYENYLMYLFPSFYELSYARGSSATTCCRK